MSFTKDYHTCIEQQLQKQVLSYSLDRVPRKRKLSIELGVREICATDYWEVCSWIRSPEELAFVCDDVGDYLTPSILERWLEKAETSLIISENSFKSPLGFCTLSRKEAPGIPENYIELCHLIVHPEHRYLTIGSFAIEKGKEKARELGAELVYGRIVPSNVRGLALAKFKGALEASQQKEPWFVSGFRWFYVIP